MARTPKPTPTPDCPDSWAHRDLPPDLPSLLEWLERVARPHLAVVAPDRCVVSNNANSAKPVPDGPSPADLALAAETLWDEVSRACDWLQFFGHPSAPVRPHKTIDPDESQLCYWEVRSWICSKLGAADSGSQSAADTAGQTSLRGEEKALAVLVSHPEWTDKKIAEHVGCHRTSLYRWGRYTAAREAQQSARQERPRADHR